MSPPVRAVLFDLDGTLADSEHIAAAALSAAFAEAGLTGDPPLEQFRAMSGMALEEILARLRLPPELAGPFRAAARRMTGQIRLFPGTLALLHILRARGIRVGVITGKDRARTLLTLEHLEIGGLLDGVVTPDDPPAPKPSPEGVWWLCRRLGVTAQQTVLAGDGAADLRAGSDAGVRTVACLWGTGRPEILARQAPWQTVTSIGELTILLDGLTAPAATPAPAGRQLLWPRARQVPGAGPQVSGGQMADVLVPSSKSITNRGLFLAAAADGRSVLHRPLAADDTEAFARALTALGYDIATTDPDRWEVTGRPAGPATAVAGVHTRDGATGARFLPALAAAGHGTYRFDASEQMRRRPMAPLLQALRQLGADIDGDALPYTLRARGLAGGLLVLDAGISSQFLTALLLAGPLTRRGLTIEVTRLVSAPYIDITLSLMRRFGATADRDGNLFLVEPGGYTACALDVEPDASTASYFLAAAAVTGNTVTIPGLGTGSRQGDLAFADILAAMGAKVTVTPEAVTVTGPSQLAGITADLHHCSDTMPTLAAIAPLAAGPVRIENIYNTRLKECDRLQACADGLHALGVPADTGEDWIQITPAPPRAGTVRTMRDHRIAMAFCVLGLRVPGLELDDPQCVIKTCPRFHDLLAGLAADWSHPA